MTRSKLYILDVSGFIFRAYYAIPSMTNARGESTNGLFGFIRSVIKLFKDFNPEHCVAVFDGPDNKKQRLEIYEKYKANRVRILPDIPLQIDRAKEFCQLMGMAFVEISGVEADDAIGSIALWAKKNSFDIFICTSDKDLCQVVQDHIYIINPWKENSLLDREKVIETYGVTPEQISDYLAIVGDASDNIPGLKGFGPKTTIPLLKQYGNLENLLAHADEFTGKKQETLTQDAEIARLSKRLASIHTDVAFEKDPSVFKLQSPDIVKLRSFYLDMSFNSLVREMDSVLEKIPEQKARRREDFQHYYLINDENTLNELIDHLQKVPQICMDVEATSQRAMEARVVGFGFCTAPSIAYYVPLNGSLGKEFVLKKLKPLLENSALRFFGHNIKYDCHLLVNEGIHVPTFFFDILLASYLLNSASRSHSLDNLALQYFEKVKISMKSLTGTGRNEIGMMEVPIEKVTQYCCEDADYAFRIKDKLEAELEKRKLTPLLNSLELPLSLVLAKMERIGMYVDVEKLKEMSSEISKDIIEIEEQIYILAGERFNISSPKQLSAILFEKMGIKPVKKTATGLSTRAEVLETLAISNPIAQKIIEFRTLEKLRSTYLDTLPLEVYPQTGRIHPTFNQSVTATGRLSCQNPNLQNIPTRTPQGKKIREAFRPQKKGWSYLAADYSQIELRLLAHLSQDPKLIKAFRAGEDIHIYTASLVFGINLDEVTVRQRHQAKAINFGIIYGQQAFGLSQELGVEIREAAKFIEAYFERYPNVLHFIEHCIQEARKTGKTITMIGREREVPEIHSKNAIIRSAAERLAINTPLQGTAADLIKLAMLEIDRKLTQLQLKTHLILQIHDELIFEVPDEELELLEDLVKTTMETVFALKVPLLVDVSVGKNWGEC